MPNESPITSRQQSFIERLAAERGVGGETPDHPLASLVVRASAGDLTRYEASRLIDALKSVTGRGRPNGGNRDRTVRVTDPGMYRHDGVVFVVKPNRDRTGLYANRLVEIGGTRVTDAGTFVNVDFQYDRGAIFDIDPADRMPFEEAKALTIRYGRCVVCGRFLKAGESVERGIGPVCRKRFPDAGGESARDAERRMNAAVAQQDRDENVRVARAKAARDDAAIGQRRGAAGGVFGPDGYMIADGMGDAIDAGAEPDGELKMIADECARESREIRDAANPVAARQRDAGMGI